MTKYWCIVRIHGQSNIKVRFEDEVSDFVLEDALDFATELARETGKVTTFRLKEQGESVLKYDRLYFHPDGTVTTDTPT